MEEMKFFDLNVRILKLSGLWVPNFSNKWKHRRTIAYNSICILYSMIYFTIAELISLKESAANLNDLVKNLNMLMSFLLTLIKVIVWFRYRKDILKIIRFLETPRNVFKDYNLNNEEIILKELEFKDTWTKSFFIMSTLVPLSAGILSITETLTTGEKYVVFRNDSSLIYIQKLPYYSWIPFDHTSSKCAFRIAVVSQCIALLNCGYITVGKIYDVNFIHLLNFSIFSRFRYAIPVGVRLLGNELAYLLAIEIQVAVYCFVGNKLTDAVS
ncbi:polyserase-related [Holotrichia oblita]|uniref:Polyserase-related n=1 Tax=Holotrichia oblita TaxID=644536 RepID=A0ACB9SV71_HOLOL|nr:polyserase-related [Holotrichia oblita]